MRVIPDDLPEGIDLPQLSSTTAAGIGVAIAGNVLISLALNCQKLAHRRLEHEREAAAQAPQPLLPTHGNSHLADQSSSEGDTAPSTPIPAVAVLETQPLLDRADGTDPDSEPHTPARRWGFFRKTGHRHHAKEADRSHLASTHALMPVDVVIVRTNSSAPRHGKQESQDGSEGDYLKSKLWWLGFLLMNLGEMGNFISYAFAPASVVAPLGTFALIANCIFAPLMLKERFRKRDFLGIIIAVLGAVTVVLSANPSDTRLDPDGLIKAITTRPFEIYAITYVAGIVILSGLSEGPAGKRLVYVDVGLCALFGGFTVLSTKAVSTLLTMEWFEIFKEWITYPVIAVLIGTGIGQIRYLNRALMRFDSKIVVPTQFVMFNLSAIVGSAILYGDFKKATFHQLVTFLYGCGATFAGVFIIAWAPSGPPRESEDDVESEDDASSHFATLPGSRNEPASSAATADDTLGSVKVGSLARRNRPTLVMPEGAAASATPILHNRHSVVSLYGFSLTQVSPRSFRFPLIPYVFGRSWCSDHASPPLRSPTWTFCCVRPPFNLHHPSAMTAFSPFLRDLWL
ncbi:magnesium transporter NIPA-domain-containing protein [Cerioporus squamosus]|nr:magnesium transporter NIPA-domain-containing protein [Cerioporus squamosus]